MFKRLLRAALAILVASLPLGMAHADSVVGAGSTFAHPILAAWGKAFTGQQGEGGAVVSPDSGWDYEPVGSLGGVMRAIGREVDFGATDVPLPPEDLDRRRLDQFPIVSGGVAVVVNLPGVASGTLRLSGEVLARIYLGEITRWSDPALAALNPGRSLPDAPIVVHRRSDGSGTTFHFASYLAGVSEDWNTRVGIDTLLVWPTGVPAKGNAELAARVKATTHAIGYVEASQAARLGLTVALVQNRSGTFVAPTQAALQAALASTNWDPARHFYAELSAPSGIDAYPMTATVYALMPRQIGTTVRSRRVLAFFRTALTEFGADATRLGYVPLPDQAVRQVFEYWRTAAARPAR